jgi:hypothetical protein
LPYFQVPAWFCQGDVAAVVDGVDRGVVGVVRPKPRNRELAEGVADLLDVGVPLGQLEGGRLALVDGELGDVGDVGVGVDVAGPVGDALVAEPVPSASAG